jgi:hypothetical protein
MSSFLPTQPTNEDYWRGIILLGRNVATYKLALAKSLLELAATGKTFVKLEDLAVPYRYLICLEINHFGCLFAWVKYQIEIVVFELLAFPALVCTQIK